MDNVEIILQSRTEICSQVPLLALNTEEEGGCGVTGFISSIPVTGKNILSLPSRCTTGAMEKAAASAP